MFAMPIKFSRVTFALCIVFILVDLFPHPALSPGLIETSFSKVQQAVTQSAI